LLHGSGLIIDAVEPDMRCADEARPFYRRVIVSGIEQADLGDERYDAVVCADVLEHLPEPAAALHKLKRNAVPGALFIVSVPNVAHISIRLMLLAGRFPRMDKGILDRGHLHFFTRRTAGDMLEEAGLRVERTIPTPVPLEELLPADSFTCRVLMLAQAPLIGAAPGLFAYQWILLARKPLEP